MGRLTPECRTIASYIIKEVNKYNSRKKTKNQVIMTVKRLQKLVYFCDVEYMKRNQGKSLFEDDYTAWPSGPVIDELYYEFVQLSDGKLYPSIKKLLLEITDETKYLINDILKETQYLDTFDLVEFSKVTDGPWHQVYKEGCTRHVQLISKEEMYKFYLDKQLFEFPTKEDPKKLSLFKRFNKNK